MHDNQQCKNNYVDTCIVYHGNHESHDTLRALIVFEYKAKVHPDPKAINLLDLLEAWLYGYYIISKETTSIYLCLTDTKVWHYFSVVKRSGKMAVQWAHTFIGNEVEHVQFVIKNIRCSGLDTDAIAEECLAVTPYSLK